MYPRWDHRTFHYCRYQGPWAYGRIAFYKLQWERTLWLYDTSLGRRSYACVGLRPAGNKRIAAAVHPEQVLRRSAAGNVILERPGFIGLLRVTTTRRSLGIEFVSVVYDVKRSVATAREVQLVVDNAISESTCGMRVRIGRREVCPAIGYWIVLVRGILGAVTSPVL